MLSGHELMHVCANRDILTSVAAVAPSSALLFSSSLVRCPAVPAATVNAEPLAMFRLYAGAHCYQVIQMAISRTREFDADETVHAPTGDPLVSASALNKLESGVNVSDTPNRNIGGGEL